MIRTSWPASCSCSAMNRPTLPPPAMTTRISALPWPVRPPAARRRRRARRRPRRGRRRRPPGRRGRRVGTWATPRRLTADDPHPARLLELGERAARPRRRRSIRSTSDTLALGSTHSTAGLVGQDAAQHPLGRPRHGGDGGDAEPLVDGGPAGVVDAGDDSLDAEGLAGHAGDEDVGVVAVGDGGDGARPARCPPRAGGRGRSRCRRSVCPLKSLGRRLKASGRLSMTATVWPRLDEVAGQGGAHPAAADDDDVHWTLSSVVSMVRWRERAPTACAGSGAAGAAS